MSSTPLQYLKVSSILSQYESWAKLARQGPARGPFWIFQHPLLSKIKKSEGGTLWVKKFRNKNLTMRKKLKVGPFGFFQHPTSMLSENV